MARPDIKDERREQILNAFEACVARSGIEGATLAGIAEAAGVARPLIRHNVGNREDLVAALVERFMERSRRALDDLIAALPHENRLTTIIEQLFDPQFSDAQLVQVSNALIAASADDPALANKMRAWLRAFVSRIERVIAAEYPGAPSAHVAAVAAGITGVYFNVEALYPLGNIKALAAASKEAALLLAASLEK